MMEDNLVNFFILNVAALYCYVYVIIQLTDGYEKELNTFRNL